MSQDFSQQRYQLTTLLRRHGVYNNAVLAAMGRVPREFFVEDGFLSFAYSNQALPLSLGQTISQPLMVGVMTQALYLEGSERVLEVGTGSGYQAAILALLCAHVYSIERYAPLSELAAQRFKTLRIENISLRIGDGTLGWPEEAPFDRILVTAAAPHVPTRLASQLVPGGLMVVPVGEQSHQTLTVVKRVADGLQVQSLGECVFVPLIGDDAW
jgi:protein-L-isoaspartate(D-aspartate) O-methyltransferase